MSSFSGKCDVNDELYIMFNGDYEAFKKHSHLYRYDGTEIEINCPADLIPWYTHITAMASGEKLDNGDYKWIAHLSKEDYLDERLNDLIEYNKLAAEEGFPVLSDKYILKCKQDLKDLYEREKVKPISEQKIYDRI